tara:strand:- start:177287 stop:177865 length:579 start_codon:yes stop_codon:yes gene_type:complete
MKKLITLLIAITITSAGIKANQFDDDRGRSNDPRRIEIRKDVRQLQRFEQKLDKFSYAMLVGDLYTARYLKNEILDDMERELNENNRNKYRDRMDVMPYSKRRVEGNGDYGTIYSKRNGAANANWKLSDRRLFEIQSELYFEFRNLRLNRGRRGIMNENRHRAIMYEFRDTMKKEIRQERGEINKTRRGNNW